MVLVMLIALDMSNSKMNFGDIKLLNNFVEK
jgi:hypothetical protein